MSDLIKREDAIKALQKEINKGIPPFDDTMGAIRCGVRLARNIIEDLPSADRPQGEWIIEQKGFGVEAKICSVCGAEKNNMSKFCPNCGAEMRGAENE